MYLVRDTNIQIYCHWDEFSYTANNTHSHVVLCWVACTQLCLWSVVATIVSFIDRVFIKMKCLLCFSDAPKNRQVFDCTCVRQYCVDAYFQIFEQEFSSIVLLLILKRKMAHFFFNIRLMIQKDYGRFPLSVHIIATKNIAAGNCRKNQRVLHLTNS